MLANSLFFLDAWRDLHFGGQPVLGEGSKELRDDLAKRTVERCPTRLDWQEIMGRGEG
jgi:hypothetical protein